MSTSLLYHGFGIRGYKYVSTRYGNRSVTFTIRQDPSELCCPNCGSKKVVRRGATWRRFRSVPIGLKPVWISMAIQRVFCLMCSVIRQVKFGFADRRRSYTKAFERYALELSKHMTIQDVAHHLGVSWGVIKDIQKRNLLRRFRRPKLKSLKRIAIDEISIGKGHRYLTIVFDHFHIVKLFNEKLSDLRRKLYHYVSTKMEKAVPKGTRWLLLKNPENLDDKKDETQRLQDALEINQPLATAYYMKEDLRQFWAMRDKVTAEAFLDDWARRARVSKIPILSKFANTLMAYRTGILAYYDYPISTGPLEGTNNKIKTMKRQAYGFRDMEFFKLKIMAIHESKYALIG